MELPVSGIDFPPNLLELRTANLALYVVFAPSAARVPVQPTLQFTPDGSTANPIGGAARSTTDGVVSTRLGNAPSWLPMLDKAPYGRWTLSFPDTPELRRMFAEEAVDDLVFVISYAAGTPEWPM